MAKKLTLDLFERIIDAVYEKAKQHPDMEIGDGSRFNTGEYIGFYAMHGGLFWSEQDGKICGVATAHPGRADFSWTWPESKDGSWTAHLVWSENVVAHASLLRQFLESQAEPVTELWAWKGDKFVELTRAKLKRLFSYGQKRHNHSSTSSSELRRVDAGHSQSTGGNGSAGVCEGGRISAKISSPTV